jgi:large subunit ribosomal protein L24
MLRLRKNDEVIVISGKDKGAKGKILKVIAEKNAVIIEGVNRVKRHTKPTQKLPQGGIIEKELPVHVSKVMPLDPKSGKPTRIKIGKDKDGNKIRLAAKSGTSIES